MPDPKKLEILSRIGRKKHSKDQSLQQCWRQTDKKIFAEWKKWWRHNPFLLWLIFYLILIVVFIFLFFPFRLCVRIEGQTADYADCPLRASLNSFAAASWSSSSCISFISCKCSGNDWADERFVEEMGRDTFSYKYIAYHWYKYYYLRFCKGFCRKLN